MWSTRYKTCGQHGMKHVVNKVYNMWSTWYETCGQQGMQHVVNMWSTWYVTCGQLGMQHVVNKVCNMWSTWYATCGQQGMQHVVNLVCNMWSTRYATCGQLGIPKLHAVNSHKNYAPWKKSDFLQMTCKYFIYLSIESKYLTSTRTYVQTNHKDYLFEQMYKL